MNDRRVSKQPLVQELNWFHLGLRLLQMLLQVGFSGRSAESQDMQQIMQLVFASSFHLRVIKHDRCKKDTQVEHARARTMPCTAVQAEALRVMSRAR